MTSAITKRVITFGTFDVFHIGHYNILKRSKSYGTYLIVGISSDELNMTKGKNSVWDLQKRIKHVESTGLVDLIFVEESLEKKKEYIMKYKADLLIMGDDWKGAFDWVGIPCLYLERTKNISSTLSKITNIIENNKDQYMFYFINRDDTCAIILSYYFNILKINYGYITDLNLNKSIKNCIIIDNDSNIDSTILNYDPKIIIIQINSKLCNTNWNIKPISNNINYLIVSGPAYKKSMDYLYYDSSRIISTGYLKSNNYLSYSKLYKKEDLVKLYNIDINKPIILYAPKKSYNSEIFLNIINQLDNSYKNYIVSINYEHIDELIKSADIIISDSCSVLTKALILSKKTIQLYDDEVLPISFGICKYFVGGIISNFNKLTKILSYLMDYNQMQNHDIIYEIIYYNIKKGIYIADDSYEKIIKELVNINILRKYHIDNTYINYKNICRENIKNDFKKKHQIKIINNISDFDEIYTYYYIKTDNISLFDSNTTIIVNTNIFNIKSVLKNIILEIHSLEEYQYLESIKYPMCILSLSNYSSKDILDMIKYINYGYVELFGIIIPNINDSYFISALQSFGTIIYYYDILNNTFNNILFNYTN
jgi:glycerol-3-phosphate cytidylyltransferase